jgi:hypothetical protein
MNLLGALSVFCALRKELMFAEGNISVFPSGIKYIFRSGGNSV